MEDDQQFCLRWNNHQSTLISVFDSLLENEKLVDCTLAAEGRIMKAHKVVLSACSPYFATLLQEQYDKHPIFILKDVKFQELRAMMDYMYRGEVNISQDQLAALLKAAESLQIKGLSDNRTGGGQSGAASSRAEQQQHQQQQQQQQQHHRGLNVPGGKLHGGYTIEAQTKRARVGAGPMDTQDMSASREGSSSPSRRRRKVRRRSIENALAGEPHDNSNSSQQQSNVNLAAAASALVSQQLPVSLAGGNNLAAAAAAAAQLQQQQQGQQMTTTSTTTSSATQAAAASSVTKKTEIVKGATTTATTSDAMNTENVQVSAAAAAASAGGAAASTTAASSSDVDNLEQQQQQQQQSSHAKIEKQNHKQKSHVAGKDGSELVIEPKSEYDDEANDETCEDLTLDDEDMGMDDLDQNAGTSQGGEGSSQGYPWPHERSQDELLLTAQDAQQRDPQGCSMSTSSATTTNSSQTPPPPHSFIRDYWYELKFSDLFKFINPDGRYQCPRYNCLKSYKDASSLQRHIRYECGGQKKFRCLMCGKAFSQSSHLKRHLESGVCVKYYL